LSITDEVNRKINKGNL